MKIGIITFHWGTNYGAVLQAFALQKYLTDIGNTVEIIDYYPVFFRKNVRKCIHPKHPFRTLREMRELIKEKKLECFRKKFLNRTPYFSSNNELRSADFNYDCFISGSDQIWNMSFIKFGEQRKTFSYFLDFVPNDRLIVSYAASFGTCECEEDLKDEISTCLKRYDFVSVRETSGLKIVKELGIKEAVIVPDPTLLLQRVDYERLFKQTKSNKKSALVYMLHDKMSTALPVINAVSKKKYSIKRIKQDSIKSWLYKIYNSDLVITNSFHGIVFSIIFHVPFVAMLIEGSGMNDRIHTLLGELGLNDRIFNGDMSIIEKEINWKNVDEKLNDYRIKGQEYLNLIIGSGE